MAPCVISTAKEKTENRNEMKLKWNEISCMSDCANRFHHQHHHHID